MGRISRGWELTKASFRVIKLDKEILWLPVLSFLTLVVLVGAELGVGLVALASAGAVSQNSADPLFYVLLFLVYVTVAFVGTFFLAATIEMASIRLAGGDPVVKDGLSKAWAKKGKLLQWAIIAATVGIVLRAIRERANVLGRIVTQFLELGWAIATYFVVPILVYHDIGPWDAVRKSVDTLKRTWGEAATGVVSTGLIFFLLGLLGIVPVLLGIATGSAVLAIAGVVVAVVYWVVLVALNSAVRGVLVAALYRYAETGELPEGFEAAAPPSAGPV